MELEEDQAAYSTARSIFATLWLSISFLLLYSGYNALQTQLPLQRPTIGPLTIALSYLAYSVTALLVPAQTVLLRRIAFSLAAATFVFWIIGTIYDDWVLAVVSIINGGGAGLLWTTEGVWLSSQPTKFAGRISATVLALFHFATIVGQLAAEYTDMFIPALVTSSAAAALLLVMPSPWLGPPSESQGRQFRPLMRSDWKYLIPSIMTFGFASSLVWVYMPTLLQDNLSWGFIIFSGCSVVLFPIAGFMADRTVLKGMFYAGATAHALLWGFDLIALVTEDQALGYMPMAAIGNTFLNQAIVRKQTELGELSNSAFAAQVSLYCMCYAAGSALIAYNVTITISITLLLTILTACFT
jgi:hypothetical protein